MPEPHPFDCLPAHIRRDVEAHIERREGVSKKEIKALAAVFSAVWDISHVWDVALDAARGAALDAALDAARDDDRAAVREVAWPATLALITRDLISEEQFNTLYGPWASVMGEFVPDCSPERVRQLEARITTLEDALRGLLAEYRKMEELAHSA